MLNSSNSPESLGACVTQVVMSLLLYDEPLFTTVPMIYPRPVLPLERVLLPETITPVIVAEPIMPLLEVPFMPRPVVYSPALEPIDPLLLGWQQGQQTALGNI